MAHVGGKKKALLIAIKDNEVSGLAKLNHVHQDARELKRLLIDFGYPECEITLMVDHKSVSSEFWPTRTNIRKQILRFVKGVSAGDRLFFYYAGHGHQVTCNHHTERDGLDEVIYTCRQKQIMDNDLKRWLVNPLPPGCKLFALWDSCHSQTILDLDHTTCNEPERGRRISWDREASLGSMLLRVIPKRLRRNVGVSRVRCNPHTISPEVLRGRPVSRASVSITTLSSGNSPTSKFIPLSMDLNRVLSPLSFFECNGKCPLPTEHDIQAAHVISLSACQDNESAVDECRDGQVRTVTKFFIDHMRKSPKSTLRELLMAIREGVDEITAARQEWGAKPRAISRQTTFTSERRIQTRWIPQPPPRRSTVVDLDEYLNFTPSRSNLGEYENDYSQKPSYSSHHRLNLDEPVNL